MRNMILAFLCALAMAGCEYVGDPVLTTKDWEGESFYYDSEDEMNFGTYYKPYSGYVGDPMPFYDPIAKNFKVLYLQDYRPNPTATYHPIWGLTTSDAANYTSLGEVIECGGQDEQDAALGTGCVVYNPSEKLYYVYYTGNKYLPSSSESGEVVMRASSPDFETWTKDRNFYLKGETDGYSKSDFRDPCIFEDEEGLYHMIVATNKSGQNLFAEYTSSDLKSWEHAGVFMNMVWDRFFECPDIFKMGDWWYLVYSDMHSAIRKVQYFKGKTLEEIKACASGPTWPDDHEGYLDSRALYAGKTATDGTTRYLWGWCPTRDGEDNTAVGAYPSEPAWAGNLVAHTLVQHEDGTLTLGPVKAIDSKYSNESSVSVMQKTESLVSESNGTYSLSGDSYILFNRLNRQNKISFSVQTETAFDKFAISLVRGGDSDKYYSLVVNPESETKRKINFEEEGSEGMGFIDGIDSYLFDTPSDNIYNISIYTDNSVVTLYINDNLAYTNRIYGTAKNCWSINNYGGNISVKDIKVYNY